MQPIIKTIILTLVFTAAIYLPAPVSARASDELLCSTFPVYLFTRNITQGSDSFKVNLLVNNAKGCPHDYNPTPAELERLAQAGVLVINGLGLEGFLSQASRVTRTDLVIIDASGGRPAALAWLSGAPKLSDPAVISSREAVRDLYHDHEHGHSHNHDAEPDEPNPHLFASPRTAVMLVENIVRGLAEIDPANADLYQKNGVLLAQQLTALTGEAVSGLRGRLDGSKVIVSHSTFDYLAQDWGLNIVATIEEEDGAEPSAARLTELARLARREGVKAILIDPTGNLPLARTLGAEVNIPVAVIDPVASGPMNAPLDYYQAVMLNNLSVLLKLFVKPESEPLPPTADTGMINKK